MTDILPTHHCFDDAMELLELRVKESPRLVHMEVLVLVHAICLIPDNAQEGGQRFAHAWLEEITPFGTHAWQAGLLDGERIVYAVDAAELARELRVERAWRYTPRQVWEQNEKHITYGPWEPELQALCRKKDA